MKKKSLPISEYGEFSLIERLHHILPKTSREDMLVDIGDDCAVIQVDQERALLLTCDIQVQDRHFQLENTNSYQLGRRAMAVNLSDIAAMGGRPLYALVSLGLPPDLEVDDYDTLFEGMRDELKEYQAFIIGGNLAQTEKNLVIDITLVGEVHPFHFVERKGAEISDQIYLTGEVGTSAAGFTILQKYGSNYPEGFGSLVEKHRQPQPRITVGQKLSQRQLVSAMIDVSDGIASDLYHICQKSQVGAEIMFAQLPFPEKLSEVSKLCHVSVQDLILHSGEDYELLFTVKSTVSEQELKTMGQECEVPFTHIGKIVEQNQGLSLIDEKGNRIPLQPRGWDHFKAND
jgi:thiamine-monophosphate kinase